MPAMDYGESARKIKEIVILPFSQLAVLLVVFGHYICDSRKIKLENAMSHGLE